MGGANLLEIPGAGPNGASLFANIVGFEGSGVVNLDTKAIVEVSSGTGIKIAHKTKISSVNTANNTITLATAATHAVTNESVIINPQLLEI